jgi:arginyl-tRNA synthetase
MDQLAERGYRVAAASHLQLEKLTEEHETELLNQLSRYPEVIESAARNHEPHQLAYFLRELANAFHTYYNTHQFLVEDEAVRSARLALILATRHILAGGLKLLGVSAPEKM